MIGEARRPNNSPGFSQNNVSAQGNALWLRGFVTILNILIRSAGGVGRGTHPTPRGRIECATEPHPRLKMIFIFVDISSVRAARMHMTFRPNLLAFGRGRGASHRSASPTRPSPGRRLLALLDVGQESWLQRSAAPCSEHACTPRSTPVQGPCPWRPQRG